MRRRRGKSRTPRVPAVEAEELFADRFERAVTLRGIRAVKRRRGRLVLSALVELSDAG